MTKRTKDDETKRILNKKFLEVIERRKQINEEMKVENFIRIKKCKIDDENTA